MDRIHQIYWRSRAHPNKVSASVAAAVKAVSVSQPKAILLLAAGKPATEFARAVRDTPAGTTQIYGISVLLHDDLVKAIGLAGALWNCACQKTLRLSTSSSHREAVARFCSREHTVLATARHPHRHRAVGIDGEVGVATDPGTAAIDRDRRNVAGGYVEPVQG